MFPVYPLLCLAAALAISTAAKGLGALFRAPPALATSVGRLAVLGIALISAMRSAALVSYYAAPLHLYAGLHDELGQALAGSSQTASVCVGNEWSALRRHPSRPLGLAPPR